MCVHVCAWESGDMCVCMGEWEYVCVCIEKQCYGSDGCLNNIILTEEKERPSDHGKCNGIILQKLLKVGNVP